MAFVVWEDTFERMRVVAFDIANLYSVSQLAMGIRRKRAWGSMSIVFVEITYRATLSIFGTNKWPLEGAILILYTLVLSVLELET
jgi:hypothetical protein